MKTYNDVKRCVESVKGDQVLPLLLLERDFQNTSNKSLLFIVNLWTNLS